MTRSRILKVAAFGQLANKSNTVILPANLSEPGNFVAGALTIFNQLQKGK